MDYLHTDQTSRDSLAKFLKEYSPDSWWGGDADKGEDYFKDLAHKLVDSGWVGIAGMFLTPQEAANLKIEDFETKLRVVKDDEF